jgi:hypothetical protein
MLKITQAPQGSVVVKQQFTITGIASTSYASSNLTLTIDNQYTSMGPLVELDGTWELNFLFQQIGDRHLRLSIGSESVELTIPVVAAAPPPPSSSKVTFAIAPQQVQAGQATTFTGTTAGYAEGTRLLLRADQQYELARPQVQGNQWQAQVVFGQAGRRLIEIIGAGQDRAQATVLVVAAPPPPARPPRVRFTVIPQLIREEEVVAIAGEAADYPDDAQLVLRVDRKFELARPRVQGGKWQAPVLFRQPGQRLLEVVGSEQDRASITITVQINPNVVQIQPRSVWIDIPTPTDLPTFQPKRITLHHTALPGSPPPNATVTQEAERMRFIWRSHINGNGWSDTGYHYIIMPSGRIYEARAETRRGAHDLVNDGLGVAFDGIFSTAPISPQQFDAAVDLCTVLCQRYGFKDPITPVPTPTVDYGIRNLPLICTHRDRVKTQCPGTEGGKTVRLDDIRRAVKARL